MTLTPIQKAFRYGWPLLLFYFRGQYDYFKWDKIDVLVAAIYLAMIGNWLYKHYGKAISPQAIWEGGHMSINQRQPDVRGHWAIFRSGIMKPAVQNLDETILICYHGNYTRADDNFLIKTMPVPCPFNDLPLDVKYYIQQHQINTEETQFLIGVASRAYITANPDITRMMEIVLAAEDLAWFNKKARRGKLGDFDEFMRTLANWSKYGADQGILADTIDTITGKKTNNTSDIGA